MHVDGLPTVIFAMDANEQSLLAGTVDGRIAVLDVGALCESQDVNADADIRTDSAATTQATQSVINLD
ncbi:hypothetical protein D3C72_2020610 [compost metagenome]